MTIKELRTNNLLSQREFAEKIGTSLMSVQRWEKGYAIRYSSLRKIAKAFKLSNRDALLLMQESLID